MQHPDVLDIQYYNYNIIIRAAFLSFFCTYFLLLSISFATKYCSNLSTYDAKGSTDSSLGSINPNAAIIYADFFVSEPRCRTKDLDNML